MKKIIAFSSMLILASCTSLPFLNNDNPSDSQSPQGDYVDLQVKIHSTYSLFKALNIFNLSVPSSYSSFISLNRLV